MRRSGDKLSSILDSVQARLEARLQEIRVTHGHAATKGAKLEVVFRDFLTQVLPPKFIVSHGEVVDTSGRMSKQTDIIVASDDHPRFYPPTEAGLYFIEGVLAAGEIKTTLNSAAITDCISKALAFRELSPRPPSGPRISRNPNRFMLSPPWFVIAFESQCSIDAIKEALNAEGRRSVDAFFILDKGHVVDLADGKDGMEIEEAGQLLTGYLAEYSDSLLPDLVVWLYAVMPRSVSLSLVLDHYLFGRNSSDV